MAYTGSPTTQTYSSPTLPAAYGIDLRTNSKYISGNPLTQDAGMVNVMPTKTPTGEKGVVFGNTRQAITATRVVNSNLINRGCYVWEKSAGTIYYFSVNGTGVYTSTDGTTWTLVNTLLTNATTPVRFTEFINDTNTKSLILVDGIEGYVFTSNAAGTKITDVDFPSPHLPFPVFLDGYLFLAKAGTADIYNSDLNNPSAWTAGSFISSELYPDDLQALVKMNNYILAVGLEGCEFFYDVANATGTPLGRYEGGSMAFGTSFPNSIAYNKHQVVMLANNNDGEFVLKVIEDFKGQDADPSFIVQTLNARLTASSNAITAAGVRGYFMRQSGDNYYVIAFQGDTASPNLLNKTFALNLETGKWTELRVGSTGDAPYPVYFVASGISTRVSTFVSGHYGGTPFFGRLDEVGSAIDTFTNGAGSVPIYTEIRTPSFNFGTQNIKFMNRLGITAVTSDSSTGAVNISVSWSDDDYATFSTARTLDASGTTNFPFLTQLGSFRQRAFKFTYSGSAFLQWRILDFDINKGQQ